MTAPGKATAHKYYYNNYVKVTFAHSYEEFQKIAMTAMMTVTCRMTLMKLRISLDAGVRCIFD